MLYYIILYYMCVLCIYIYTVSSNCIVTIVIVMSCITWYRLVFQIHVHLTLLDKPETLAADLTYLHMSTSGTFLYVHQPMVPQVAT